MAGQRARSARPASRRSHSQHFLRSTRLAAALVREAAVDPDDLVLDIGAGAGALTVELARRARHVLAIEIDPALTSRLRHRFDRVPNVDVVEGDALRIPLPAEPFRVVANVPFNATTGVLRRLLDDPGVPLQRADLVVALDVAWKRARVTPSTALGAYWGAWFEFTLVRRLDASAFSPRPGVDAGVLRIARRARPLVSSRDREAYRGLVVAAFARRSPVRREIRGLVSPRELKRLACEHGFSPDALPWELDQHQWAGVHEFVRSRR